MKTPGPDHPIALSHDRKRVCALYQGHVIADTAGALTLKEGGYRPVHYFPREDVSMEFMTRTDRVTTCPYKGEASYYTLLMDGHFAENAVWSYEDPYPAVDAIRGMLAFYPDKVEVYETDETVGDDAIRDIVEHTDSGSGASQLEHWAPNVLVQDELVARPYKDTGSI